MATKERPKLAVLVSGIGSLLRAIIESGLEVDLVIADRQCLALDFLSEYYPGIKQVLIERTDFSKSFNYNDFTAKVVTELTGHNIDVVALAGFQTKLSGVIFDFYSGRMLNSHPSLLSLFPGNDAVAQALAAGVTETGCTIHMVTEEVDAGPILAQEKVPIVSGDTVASVHELIKQVEQRLYPEVIRSFMEKLERAK